jgi:hypothetical protein
VERHVCPRNVLLVSWRYNYTRGECAKHYFTDAAVAKKQEQDLICFHNFQMCLDKNALQVKILFLKQIIQLILS